MNRDSAGVNATVGMQAAPALPEFSELGQKAGAENFPVALRVLPRRYSDHLMAVYRFARTVDDVGDEAPPHERTRLLTELDEDLDRLYAGQAAVRQPAVRHAAVRGLAGVVADCGIPVQPFRDLVAANVQDQVVSRYETFDDLMGYCRLSANPVGRLVLYVFGAVAPGRLELSDCVCSALQVIEHLQDVAEDYRAGRIYLPQADLRCHGCTEEDLAAATAPPRLRRLIAAEAQRADGLLRAGAPLVGQLRGWGRVAVAGYVAGGRAALTAIAAADYDVLAAAPRPSKLRTAAQTVAALVRGR